MQEKLLPLLEGLVARLQALPAGGVAWVPVGWLRRFGLEEEGEDGGHLLLIVLVRHLTDEDFTVAVVNAGEGLQYHPLRPCGKAPRPEMPERQCPLILCDVPWRRVTCGTFWYLLFRQLMRPSESNSSKLLSLRHVLNSWCQVQHPAASLSLSCGNMAHLGDEKMARGLRSQKAGRTFPPSRYQETDHLCNAFSMRCGALAWLVRFSLRAAGATAETAAWAQAGLVSCESYLLTRAGFGFDDEEDDGPAMLMDGGIVDSNISRQTPGITAGGYFLHQLSAKAPGCEGFCCNLGDKEVQCLDVESCAGAGSNGSNATLPRYALVLSHYGVPTNSLLQSIKSMRAAALAAGADILVLMMQGHADQMSYKLQKRLKKWHVKVHLVPWALPPGMIYIKKVTKYDGWCGKMDLIRLHALALEGYDAIAYYDADCEFQGDILPVLQCASQGYFLSTSGGVGENLNVGFFAARPDRRLLEAAVIFARRNNFSREDGWGHSGWKPRGYYYVGGECGQGFFYTLYYSRSQAAEQALEAAGIWQNGVFEAAQLDRCLWNYQTSWGCGKDFDCERVRVHHKPTKERGSDRNECEKLRLREQRRKQAQEERLQRIRNMSAQEIAAAKEGLLLRRLALDDAA
eukprot:s21_g27.t1